MKQDYAEAAKWWRKAAEQGEADAQLKLGAAYFSGRGVTKDNAEGAEWYRKAAEQGQAVAQTNLGLLYDKGTSVKQDDAEAVKWFRKAAEQGNVMAQFQLAGYYAAGRGGLKKDLLALYAWLTIALANGDTANAVNQVDKAELIKVVKLKAVLAKAFTPAQIAQAEALAKDMIAKNPKLLNKKP